MVIVMVMAVMINLVMSYLLSLTLDVSLEPTSSLSSPCCCCWLFSTLAQESENHEPHDTLAVCLAQFVQLAKDTTHVQLVLDTIDYAQTAPESESQENFAS